MGYWNCGRSLDGEKISMPAKKILTPLGNIEKRIKRHVIAKTHRFFVATAPGLEPLCANQMTAAGICASDAIISMGGIEFISKIHGCYLANLHLRCANRILMRIASFTAERFSHLEAKTAQIPWELYLTGDFALKIHVSSQKSRLIHTGAISACVQKGIFQRMVAGQSPVNPRLGCPSHVQQIFIRAKEDRFMVSLDSSGQLLHKRGLKTNVGKAPIRETLAAAILFIAGYDPRLPLVDPMCGSGTFSLEAAMMANNIPPGWFREFAFMKWPCFKETQWRHLRREAQKAMTPLPAPMIFASDTDPAVCRKLENILHAGLLSNSVCVQQKDFFDLTPTDISCATMFQETGLIVVNPPYGRRLSSKKQSRLLFKEIGRKLNLDFKGWRFAVITPDPGISHHVFPHAEQWRLLHGGLNIVVLTGRI